MPPTQPASTQRHRAMPGASSAARSVARSRRRFTFPRKGVKAWATKAVRRTRKRARSRQPASKPRRPRSPASSTAGEAPQAAERLDNNRRSAAARLASRGLESFLRSDVATKIDDHQKRLLSPLNAAIEPPQRHYDTTKHFWLAAGFIPRPGCRCWLAQQCSPSREMALKHQPDAQRGTGEGVPLIHVGREVTNRPHLFNGKAVAVNSQVAEAPGIIREVSCEAPSGRKSTELHARRRSCHNDTTTQRKPPSACDTAWQSAVVALRFDVR